MFNFRGRINRRNYWVGHIVYTILLMLSIGAAIAGLEYFSKQPETYVTIVLAILLFAFLILSLLLYCVASAALIVRRAHDINHGGTLWVLCNFVVSSIAGIILGCIAGDKGKNQYGAPDHGSAKLDSFLTLKLIK